MRKQAQGHEDWSRVPGGVGQSVALTGGCAGRRWAPVGRWVLRAQEEGRCGGVREL